MSRRFFLPPEQKNGDMARIAGEDAHHLTHVLRLAPGAELSISCLGLIYPAQIEDLSRGEVWLRLGEPLPEQLESPLQLTLLLGLLKGEKMDWVIEKAVELGVAGIRPLFCRRCVVKLGQAQAQAKTARWQKIAEAAAKQCRRALIPQILPPLTLPEALSNLPADCHLLTAWEEDKNISLKIEKYTNIALLIGPEGGICEEEISLIRHHGGEIFGLGPRILRSETAAIAGISILMHRFGDVMVIDNY
ncbi:MAG: 16S rRNA (uracil(1498)-N(3))-methyltransferase [Clostridiales bacterium]|nr:16S rRNA (uracil(1498)-N(3))-methyltransferase [Clostridiales bacterium]